MSEKTYLAVDLGAESGRVIAGRFDGNRVSLEEVARFPNGPVHFAGSMRWDVLRLWQDIENGLRNAASRFPGEAASVGVDTWGVDYVLLSKNDELLGQPFHYRDDRNRGTVQELCAAVGRERVFEFTGLQFMEINTLCQLLACRRHTPEMLDAADRLLMIPDFFHWCLSGSRVVEFTNATTSQCLNPITRTWATEMLDELAIPSRIFPEIVQPGTILGTLRTGVAERTGLGKLNVITPATHDTGSAIAAVPTEMTGKPRWAYISSGTWSLMGVESAEAILTPSALERNVTNEGGIDGTYRVLKNIMGLWLVQQCRRSFERHGRAFDYDQLEQLAREAPAFRSLIEPDNVAFLNPADMPSAIREYCGRHQQAEPETEGQLIRCALESLALKYRRVLEWMEDLTGVRVEAVHVVGGGSQNDLLNQFTANATGRPVIAGPVEATALGNVVVQARANGDIGSLAEIRAVVRASSELRTFEPAETAAWDEAAERFTKLD